ncbi:MAG: STAS domain-containing protein [Hyphomonadaceae bacterium]
MKLTSVLDLGAAAPLWKGLHELRGQPVTVDASAVDRLGGQCLQVLLAARVQWAQDGIPFSISSPSQAFLEGAQMMMGDDDLASAET